VKPAGISGIKITEYLKDKIDELALNSKNTKTRSLFTGINKFKRDLTDPHNKI
jgi:hypothetical protein